MSHSFSASDLAVDSALGITTGTATGTASGTASGTAAGKSNIIPIGKGGGPSPNRPDLAVLHSTLLKLQPEGWRTLTPLRVGLMEVIANYL